jgi:hypothetical protein
VVFQQMSKSAGRDRRDGHGQDRTNGSLQYEHLYRLEITDALAQADEAAAFQRLYNEIRPHETLDFDTPLGRYLAPPEPNLSEPEPSNELDTGHWVPEPASDALRADGVMRLP